MKLCLFIVCVLAFACTNNGGSLASSDSLVINFSSNGEVGSAKTISTVNKTAIKKVSDYINGEAVKEVDCYVNGKLLFYKGGILTDSVMFNYADVGCQYFFRTDSSIILPVRMSSEAAAFLRGLAEGKEWY